MNVFEEKQRLLSYKDFGGDICSHERISSELSNWPLDGLLGFLSLLSIQMVHDKSFFKPSGQEDYLKLALSDDFPLPIPGFGRIIVPVRIPDMKGCPPFINEHNLAWLAHLALIHSIDGRSTQQFSLNLKARTCRLLLVANDLLSEDMPAIIEESLSWRRDFALSWLRMWQFNTYQQRWTPWIQLARQIVLMLEILPKYFNVEAVFKEATDGIALQRFYEIMVQWMVHIYHGMSTEERWLNGATLCSQLEAGEEEFNTITSKWIRTPEEYRHRCIQWRNERANAGKADRPVFDFVPLHETPLIEARPGELICPVIPFLLKKVVDEPYFIICNYLNKKPLKKFQELLGKAYEEYANSLVERIAKGDSRGSWSYEPNPKPKKNEIADSYLQKDAVGVAFEHKGLRLPTDFLLGGDGKRVLGPSDQTLRNLEGGRKVDLRKGNKSDEGLITKPMWQQSLHAESLSNWAKRYNGEVPQKIYPIITYYADVRIDRTLQGEYLHPLIKAANLYTQEYLGTPQWLHISDLEALVSLAENDKLDFESILNEKTRDYPTERFDIILHSKFEGLLLDEKLLTRATQIIQSARITFWPGDQGSTASES